MAVSGDSVWNIFYSSIKSPKDFEVEFKAMNWQRYFWSLCGLYLCLPMLAILTIVFATELLEGAEVLIIGAQVAILMPLLFLSIWLLGKLVPRISKPGEQKNRSEFYWLLASNYFFLLFAPIALIVLLANLVPHNILNNPIVSFAIFLIFFISVFLWLRSAVLLIQTHMKSERKRAIVIAVCGALAITVVAWFVVGVIGIIILVPIGLNV